MGSNPVAAILDLFWVLFHGILINPQDFAYWFSNQEIALSSEFLVPYSPKYGPILLNSHQRRYFSKQKHWKFMKDSSFYGKGTTFLGPTLNPRFLLKMTKLKLWSSSSSNSSSGSGSGSGSGSSSGNGSRSCSRSGSGSASASASVSGSGSGSSSRI